MNDPDAQARQRFMLLTLTRFVGLLLVMGGAANIVGKWLPDLSPGLGYLLLALGAADFFITPVLLKRMWQNEDQ
jgi:hypothetical protein